MKILPSWLTLLLGLPSLLAGCQAPGTATSTTQVSGRVIDDTNCQGIPHTTVQVYRVGAGGYSPVGTGYPADAQGRFSFQFDATQKYGYVVLASAPPDYSTPLYAGPSLIAGRRNDNLVIPMLIPARVKLQLVDEPPKSRALINAWGYE